MPTIITKIFHADTVGFEPTMGFSSRQINSLMPSATRLRTNFRQGDEIRTHMRFFNHSRVQNESAASCLHTL